MADAAPPDPAAVAAAISHLVFVLTATKCYMIGCFAMLVYDIFITFDIEVERVWKQKWTGATLLFAINRYLTPLLFIIIITGFFHPAFSNDEVCLKWAPFAGGGTITALAIVDLILILRTYALYGRSIIILIVLSILFIGQVSIMAWVVSTGEPLPLPDGVPGCIFASRPDMSQFTISFHVATLIFESTIFILTVARTIVLARKSLNTALLALIIRDGALYFICIVFANLLNVFFFIFMPDELKAMNASFSHIITVLLISRLILNLRQGREKPITTGAPSGYGPGGTGQPSRSMPQWGRRTSQSATTDTEQSFIATLIGTLGNPVEAGDIPLEDVSRRHGHRSHSRGYEAGRGRDYPAPRQSRPYAPAEALEDDVKPRTTLDYGV